MKVYLFNLQKDTFNAAYSLLAEDDRDEFVKLKVPVFLPDTFWKHADNNSMSIVNHNNAAFSSIQYETKRIIKELSLPVSAQLTRTGNIFISEILNKLLRKQTNISLGPSAEKTHYNIAVADANIPMPTISSVVSGGFREGMTSREILASLIKGGNEETLSDILHGGDVLGSQLSINTGFTGLTMSTRLTSIYGDEAREKSSVGELYNAIYHAAQDTDKDEIFSLIVNYFHLGDSSFSGVYNSLCFPSILFNAACLHNSMTAFADVFSLMYSDKGSIPNSVIKEMQEYFKQYSGKNLTQIGRPQQNVISRSNNVTPYYSVNYEYILALQDLILQRNTNNTDLSILYATNLFSNIIHIDKITTYIYFLFAVLHSTTKYSIDYNTDRNMFNGNGEILNIVVRNKLRHQK
jgi:hypothetical protein